MGIRDGVRRACCNAFRFVLPRTLITNFSPLKGGGALALPPPNRQNDRPERTRRFDVHSRRVPSFIRVELITVQQVGIFPRHRTTRAVQTSLISAHFFQKYDFHPFATRIALITPLCECENVYMFNNDCWFDLIVIVAPCIAVVECSRVFSEGEGRGRGRQIENYFEY